MDFTSINWLELATLAAALIVAIVGHEIAHGWVAFKFGDLTAKNQGRLSPNPLRHVDLLGTLIVPAALYFTTGLLFGWAKPVPINMSVVTRNGGYKAAIAVSLAGIGYNLALGAAALLLLKFSPFNGALAQFLYLLMAVNLVLAVFNLYPIPPLDGSRAVEYFLRMLNLHGAANAIVGAQRYGFIVLILVLVSPLKDTFFAPIRYVVALARGLL